MENEISPGVKVQVRVRDDAPTNQSCHSETSPQTGRGNPRPLAPHYDPTQSQGDADCRVATLLATATYHDSLNSRLVPLGAMTG